MKKLTRQEEHILLAVHHLGPEAYLITIREKIKEFTGRQLSVGTIYAPLNRLHHLGYLEVSFGAAGAIRGGKAKKFYKITRAGFRALAEAKEQHETMWNGLVLPKN
jgi:PadR family transcriptional regulator PadR